MLCYKCLNDTAPGYLMDLLEVYCPGRALGSSTDTLMLKKHMPSYKSYGKRSFSFTGPHVWNQLALSIIRSGSAQSIAIFKKKLKHHLFTQVYDI